MPIGARVRGRLRRLRAQLNGEDTRQLSMPKRDIARLVGTPSPVILEIGAADGLDTIELLKEFRSRDLRYYCFKPDPRNIREFRRRVNDPRVTLIESAVGEQSGKLEFFQSSTIYSSSLKEPNVENLQREWPEIEFGEPIVVDCVSLDDFVVQHGLDRIDFVWADVQGAEDLLVKGGKTAFASKVRWFYTEYSKVEYYKNEPDLGEILDLLGPEWTLVTDYGSDALLRNRGL